ncbi:MAG TPA: hypothetical protein PLX30_08785 [Methanothrix sp.]|nr:hypothetical protein [Methanothrix sp.]
MIGVLYPDEYAVRETFQLLKTAWEYYDPSGNYDVIIAKRSDLKTSDSVTIIDLSENDFFKEISVMLNSGLDGNREPICDVLLDRLRQKLKREITLVEIPPIPWQYSYMVALTHDVDITSVRERRWISVGNAIFNCFFAFRILDGIEILFAKLGLGKDPWNLFENWMALEDNLGVRSSFYFIPFKDEPGFDAPRIRGAKYNLNDKIIRGLLEGGWEVGVHGIDNWKDVISGTNELRCVSKFGISKIGTRIHWLFFDEGSLKRLDDAGYHYDTSFGYNGDVGFRAGTLQVYRPKGAYNLVELPLNIQDVSLFRRKYLNLPKDDAKKICGKIFNYARTYGGVVTLLWHQTSLAEPHNWGGLYRYLVKNALEDGAWVTKAVDIVDWFRIRRDVQLNYSKKGKKIDIRVGGLDVTEDCRLPRMRLRVHIDPESVVYVSEEYLAGDGFLDVKCDRELINIVTK